MSFHIRAAVIAFALAASLSACNSPSGGAPDGGTDTPDGGTQCFMHPKTHVEIINACTTAQGIDKQPVLPLLKSDGTLPPLP
jgi:predicted small secreted protein